MAAVAAIAHRGVQCGVGLALAGGGVAHRRRRRLAGDLDMVPVSEPCASAGRALALAAIQCTDQAARDSTDCLLRLDWHGARGAWPAQLGRSCIGGLGLPRHLAGGWRGGSLSRGGGAAGRRGRC